METSLDYIGRQFALEKERHDNEMRRIAQRADAITFFEEHEPWYVIIDYDHFDSIYLCAHEVYDLRLEMPWDVVKMADIRRDFEAHGFKTTIFQEPTDKGRTLKCTKDYALTDGRHLGSVRIFFDAETEGSMCELVVIGEKVIEHKSIQKVYDIVCPEGAEDV